MEEEISYRVRGIIQDRYTDRPQYRGLRVEFESHAPDTKLVALLGRLRRTLASSLIIPILWHSETPVVDFALDIRLQDVHQSRRDAQPKWAVIDCLA